MIFKYRLFSSSKEFETFQAENDISVCQISPYHSNLKLTADVSSADASINVAVFVVFRENNAQQSIPASPSGNA